MFVGGSKPTAALLCPWARHFTPRKYWLITQEAVAPSRHDWKIVDWDVKPQNKQIICLCMASFTSPSVKHNARSSTLLLKSSSSRILSLNLGLHSFLSFFNSFSRSNIRFCKVNDWNILVFSSSVRFLVDCCLYSCISVWFLYISTNLLSTVHSVHSRYYRAPVYIPLPYGSK